MRKKIYQSENQIKLNKWFKSLTDQQKVLFTHLFCLEADISTDVFFNIRTGRSNLTKLHCNTITVLLQNNSKLFPNTLKF